MSQILQFFFLDGSPNIPTCHITYVGEETELEYLVANEGQFRPTNVLTNVP